MSTLVSYVGAYKYLAKNDGDFSITDWVKNGEGFLFISSFADIRDKMRRLVSNEL